MIELLNIDCLQYMATLPDKAFDLAIVDPPYGTIAIFNQSKRKEYLNNEPTKDYYFELFRVSKNQIIFGVNYLKNISLCGGIIVWNKLGRDIGRRNQAPTLSDAELAYQSFNNLVKIFSYTQLGNVVGHNYQINPPEFKNRIHISQKPVALYDWLLRNYAKQGQRILDTHLGSGSSAIAAHYFGCDFVGCEIDTEYFNAAKERFDRETRQVAMF
jgi:site-specific DNA-methyltransferase (adenine-specific)